MVRSKYNILIDIDQDKHLILNSLTGNVDELSTEELLLYNSDDVFNNNEFIQKGYVIDPNEEKKLYREKYFNFLKNSETEEVQIFFVPWYLCNFNCSYCYQSEYQSEKNIPDKKIINDFFDYINSEFKQKFYVTLFGGEPLLNGKREKEFINYFIQKIKEYSIELSIVTNGYYLDEYLDIFEDVKLREIQVTLDGLEEKHNQRRALFNGSATFDKIVSGIDKALHKGFTINLRFVTDKDNFSELPKLANFCIEKGWTILENFKTQIGRNYELHNCQLNSEILFTRTELYTQIYEVLKKYPEIKEFNKPAFSVMKSLYENGELPEPIFDDCPGAKTEWAFDGYGNIYACTATVGKKGFELGRFSPTVELYKEKIEEWKSRDVTSIPECKDCKFALICGGGCAALAFNQTGKLISPDCRPIDKLIELGYKYYFND